MDSLRREMDCSDLQRQLSQLEDKLNVAVSENDRLQRAVNELEKWKEKLEKESKSSRPLGPESLPSNYLKLYRFGYSGKVRRVSEVPKRLRSCSSLAHLWTLLPLCIGLVVRYLYPVTYICS